MAAAGIGPDQQMRPVFIAFKALSAFKTGSLASIPYTSFVAQIFCRSARQGGIILAKERPQAGQGEPALMASLTHFDSCAPRVAPRPTRGLPWTHFQTAACCPATAVRIFSRLTVQEQISTPS